MKKSVVIILMFLLLSSLVSASLLDILGDATRDSGLLNKIISKNEPLSCGDGVCSFREKLFNKCPEDCKLDAGVIEINEEIDPFGETFVCGDYYFYTLYNEMNLHGTQKEEIADLLWQAFKENIDKDILVEDIVNFFVDFGLEQGDILGLYPNLNQLLNEIDDSINNVDVFEYSLTPTSESYAVTGYDSFYKVDSEKKEFNDELILSSKSNTLYSLVDLSYFTWVSEPSHIDYDFEFHVEDDNYFFDGAGTIRLQGMASTVYGGEIYASTKYKTYVNNKQIAKKSVLYEPKIFPEYVDNTINKNLWADITFNELSYHIGENGAVNDLSFVFDFYEGNMLIEIEQPHYCNPCYEEYLEDDYLFEQIREKLNEDLYLGVYKMASDDFNLFGLREPHIRDIDQENKIIKICVNKEIETTPEVNDLPQDDKPSVFNPWNFLLRD